MSDALLAFAAFAFTAALHGMALLGFVWLLERCRVLDVTAVREWSWRVALFGGVLSATLQLLGAAQPLAGQWHVGRAEEPTVSVVGQPEQTKAAESAPVVPPSKTKDVAAAPVVAVPTITLASPSISARIAGFASEYGLAALVAAWLSASLLLLARLARSLFALRRLLDESEPIVRGDLAYDLASLCATMDLPLPRLAASDAIDSPLAAPGGHILVPRWALTLPRDERRAMLAHELAHIARRDPLWRVVFAFWRALFCVVPLTGLALRRLDVIAELECDAAAARVLGDGRPLAACLVRCLEQRTPASFNAFAAAMASPRSPIMQRAERLLEGVPVSITRIPLTARALGFAAVLAAAVALPAFAPRISYAGERTRVHNADVTSSKSSSQSSLHIVDDDGNTRVRVRSPGHELDYRSSGEVTFNDSESDIERIAHNGDASIEELANGVRRRVEYRDTGNGIAKRYYRDGTELPIDADASQWLATIIPAMMRETGIEAESRVARLYSRGGARAVLDEIALIGSDHARGVYLRALLGGHTLKPDELDDTLKLAGAVGSDYERRNVLSTALEKQQMGKENFVSLLKIAAVIESSYERAELLSAAASKVANDADLRRAWLKAAAAIDSDYERRRAFTALIDAYDGEDALPEILKAAAAIGSDFEKREVLRLIAGKAHDVESLAPIYASISKGLGSDFEQREALIALLNAGPLQRAGTLAVLDAVDEIGSDFERRTVLVALAQKMPHDSEVQAKYMSLTEKMSDFERRQAQQAAGFTRS